MPPPCVPVSGLGEEVSNPGSGPVCQPGGSGFAVTLNPCLQAQKGLQTEDPFTTALGLAHTEHPDPYTFS